MGDLVLLVLGRQALHRCDQDDVVAVTKTIARWDTGGGFRSQVRRLKEGRRRLREAAPADVPLVFEELSRS